MESSFPQFPKFPIEIRLIIFGFALPPRTVIIDHNISQGVVISRKQIKEDHPALLAVNKEARQVALEKYTSVFKAPRIEFEYVGSRKAVDLRKVLKKLGLPQRGTIISMLVEIHKYMNTHSTKASRFTSFAKHRDISKDTIRPQWFDPKTDLILFRFPLDVPGMPRASESTLWGPWKSREIAKIQHAAFSMDAFDTAGRRYTGQRVWTRNGLKNGKKSDEPKPADLECLHILAGDACEVLSITADQTGLLKKGEWTFKLDTKDEKFKREMGPRWANITWRITLARNEEMNLWQLAREWQPHPYLWEQDKREICLGNDEVKTLWDIAERARHFQPMAGRTAQLLEGGDGHTYLGPSKLPGI